MKVVGLLMKMPNEGLCWYLYAHHGLMGGNCKVVVLDESGVKPAIDNGGHPKQDIVSVHKLKYMGYIYG
jgi:hypothetical protein